MSWDIYVRAYKDGHSLEFGPDELRAIFEREALPQPEWPPMMTDFLYRDGHIGLDIDDLKPRICSFAIRRIFGHTAIERVLEVAAKFNCMIFWPAAEDGAPFAAVANAATLKHLSDDDAKVDPRITPDVATFIEVVGFSSQMTSKEWIEAYREYTLWYEKNEPRV